MGFEHKWPLLHVLTYVAFFVLFFLFRLDEEQCVLWKMKTRARVIWVPLLLWMNRGEKENNCDRRAWQKHHYLLTESYKGNQKAPAFYHFRLIKSKFSSLFEVERFPLSHYYTDHVVFVSREAEAVKY